MADPEKNLIKSDPNQVNPEEIKLEDASPGRVITSTVNSLFF